MPLPTKSIATIADLARPQDLRAHTLAQIHVVTALRFVTLCHGAGHDPVPGLIKRYRHVELAGAIDGLARTISRCWPEPFVLFRPCCMAMSPDEATVARLVEQAASADREGFGATIAGFVRAERHEALHNALRHVVALLAASGM